MRVFEVYSFFIRRVRYCLNCILMYAKTRSAKTLDPRLVKHVMAHSFQVYVLCNTFTGYIKIADNCMLFVIAFSRSSCEVRGRGMI